MRQKVTWIIPGILVTLLVGLLWALPTLAAPSGADRGEIEFLDEAGGDPISYASPFSDNKTVYVQVTDADENAVTKRVDTNAYGPHRAPGRIDPASGEDWHNLADKNGDGRVDNRDIVIRGSAGTVTLDTSNGVVETFGTSGNYYLEYWVDKETTVEVMAKSNGNPNGIDVTLDETGASTGVFGAVLTICDSDLANCQTSASMLAVDTAGDTVVVEYADADPKATRRASIPLDVSRPSFSGFSPASQTSGTDDDPDFSVEVRDGESKIVDDDEATESLEFIFALYEPGAASPFSGPITVGRGEGNFEESAITNGFAIEGTFSNGENTGQLDPDDGGDEYEIHWWVRAFDQAGNMSISDSVAAKSIDGRVDVRSTDLRNVYSTEELIDEYKAGETITIAGETRIVESISPDDPNEPNLRVNAAFSGEVTGGLAARGECIPGSFTSNLNTLAGCQSHIVRVDEAAPELSSATAGNRLDGDKIKEGPDASRTSIQVVFNEAINCGSVSAEDFEVDNSAPNSVTCHEDHPESVFLGVDEMDSSDKPTVEIVGAIADRAGNFLEEGDDNTEVDAEDGMPAGLTVTVDGTADGDRPVTDSLITIGITSDERLGDRPGVTISQIHDDYSLTSGDSVNGTASPTGVTNQWEFRVSLGDAGLYNVHVTGTDLGGNIESSEGVAPDDFDADSLEDDSPVVFEVDSAVAAPAFTPEHEGSTDNPNVFLKVDFGPEASEYGLDSDGDATDKSADVDTDFDSHSAVTLTSATLDGPGYDGTDVTDMFSSRDDVLYIWRPGGLGQGTYTLTVEAEDAAGNEVEAKATFDVTARKAYSLPIEAGSNLVSLPANPADGDVNAVFGGESSISMVMTYDNASGLWQVASRDGGGTFAGNLTSIDARHAYWVVSDQSLDLKVLLPASGGLTVFPPAIEVYEGWNLVPVANVDQSKAGTVIEADDYFANISWSIAYGYDPVGGSFVKIIEGDDSEGSSDVETGKGYFVYADEKGVIIP